jgi:hypothetical protein
MIEEQLKPGCAAVGEPGLLKRFSCGRQVRTANEDVHILRVSHRRFVHGGYPRRDGIPANDRVRDSPFPQGTSRGPQPFTHPFHRVHHPLKDIDRCSARCGHALS